jgi:dihydrofolate reductase
MPELLVDFVITLDGYGASDAWGGWWGFEGPEFLRWLAEQPERDYTLLMGANTYRLSSELPPENSDQAAFGDWLTNAPKVVFSSTLQPPLSWANTRLINGDAVEAVRQMKQEGNRSLRTVGSLSLCRSLLKAGLVDRFRVVIFPVINGSTGYDRIYDGYPDVALKMVDSWTFDGRLQLLEYVPTVLSAPPGAQGGS